MTIFMFALAVALLAGLSYLLYVRLQLETLESDSPKMKRKINVYKYQESNRSVMFLMIAAIVFCLLFIGVLYNQNSLRKDNKDLELRLEQVSDADGSIASVKIESYKENALKLATFPWSKVVESRDNNTLRNYEIQLSRDWQPFFGETSIAIVTSQATKTLTVSVFAAILTYSDFQTVEKNIQTFIQELNQAKEIMMIDFIITYRDKENTLTKQAFVYSRPSKEGNLEIVELDK